MRKTILSISIFPLGRMAHKRALGGAYEGAQVSARTPPKTGLERTGIFVRPDTIFMFLLHVLLGTHVLTYIAWPP